MLRVLSVKNEKKRWQLFRSRFEIISKEGARNAKSWRPRARDFLFRRSAATRAADMCSHLQQGLTRIGGFGQEPRGEAR